MGVSLSGHPHQKHSNDFVVIPIATVAGNRRPHPLILPFAPVSCCLLPTMLVAGGHAIQQDQEKIPERIVYVASCYNRLDVPGKYLDYYPTLMKYFGPYGVDSSFDNLGVPGSHKMPAEHHSSAQHGPAATDSIKK